MAGAHDSGARVGVLTVGVPVPGRRGRDLRTGFRLPLRPGLRLATDLAAHAAWASDMARHAPPRLADQQMYTRTRASAQSPAALQAEQIDGSLGGNDLDTVRALVVKGVLHADDARRCVDQGADGVGVVDDGGRQGDAAPATLDALPAVRAAVGPGADGTGIGRGGPGAHRLAVWADVRGSKGRGPAHRKTASMRSLLDPEPAVADR